MAAPDKGLSGISIWLSLALLSGIVVLPFVPSQKTKRPASEMQAAPIGSVSGATKIVDVATTKDDPAAGASGELVKDAWTQSELTSGLRECLRLLAPVAADVAPAAPIKKGACGSSSPVKLRGLGSDEKINFRPAPTMNCGLAASLARWVETVLQPAASDELGSPITQIVGASSYSCRNIYNNPKLSLSEHATGNAIDIVGFVTADGRTIKVLSDWGPTTRDITKARKMREAAKKTSVNDRSTVHKARLKVDGLPAASKSSNNETLRPAKTKAAAFLKRLHRGACSIFGTVLGPELNEAHRNHFHFDMKHRRRRSVCR